MFFHIQVLKNRTLLPIWSYIRPDAIAQILMEKKKQLHTVMDVLMDVQVVSKTTVVHQIRIHPAPVGSNNYL